MTEQTPTTPATPTPTPQEPQQQANGNGQQATGKQPPWGKPENFNADQAWELIQNLRTEKADPQLRTELETLRTQQEQQRTALAAALGVKPEETSDADKLAQQIDTLRGQILSSERRAIAATTGVPENLLTATDADGIRQQAEALVEFAKAAHVAASTNTPPPPAPAFQQNPGQGQGNTPLTPEALAEAEYKAFYPDPAR